jgi:hypothetical protein
MRLIQTCLSAVLLFTLTACNKATQTDAAAAAKKTDALEQQVSALGKQLDESNAKVTALQGQVGVIQFQTLGLSDTSPFVVLDPTTRAYSIVKTNLGQLLVSVVDFSPYLNGYKLKLAVGNPSFATYNGAKLTVRWATTPKSGVAGFDAAAWAQTLQSKDLSVTNALLPGAWNQVEIVVAPASADQTGYLALSMVLDQVSLRQPAM